MRFQTIEMSAGNSKAIARIDFAIGEIVWAKIRGFPHWPAKVIAIPNDRMVLVVWFNDYRVTKIYRTQLFKFLKHFDEFAKKFDKHIGLESAAKEALICYGQKFYPNN